MALPGEGGWETIGVRHWAGLPSRHQSGGSASGGQPGPFRTCRSDPDCRASGCRASCPSQAPSSMTVRSILTSTGRVIDEGRCCSGPGFPSIAAAATRRRLLLRGFAIAKEQSAGALVPPPTRLPVRASHDAWGGCPRGMKSGLRCWRAGLTGVRMRGPCADAVASVVPVSLRASLAWERWPELELPRFRRHLNAPGRKPGNVTFTCRERGRRTPRKA